MCIGPDSSSVHWVFRNAANTSDPKAYCPLPVELMLRSSSVWLSDSAEARMAVVSGPGVSKNLLAV